VKNEDDEETENKVDSEGIVVEADANEIIDIESNTNALPEITSIRKKKRLRKSMRKSIEETRGSCTTQ